MTEPVLVADIGGTHARFALARGLAVSAARIFRAQDFKTIADAAKAYLAAEGATPARGCFAVAGPVTDDAVEFTNSPWVLDIAQTANALSFYRCLAVNDFEALAWGLRALTDADFVTVKPGAGDPSAPVLVMGPGTGLGQALIVPFNGKVRVIATEGGHVGFAPETDEEIAVLKFLSAGHSRVSIERLLSGEGVVNLYRARCAIAGVAPSLSQAEKITAAAIAGADAEAARALDLFCALLGRAAGDAVLSSGARGGVVLGGGILPKIRDYFLASRFVDCFLDKGRMRDYVAGVPVRLIVSDGAALKGAAAIAQEKFGTAI
ncbi:MAG: glucokinase [Parvularculaceae bacterium]